MIFLKISKYLVLEIKIYKLSGFRLSNQNVQCKLILYLTTLNTFKRGHMVKSSSVYRKTNSMQNPFLIALYHQLLIMIIANWFAIH